jgi:gas vesicle protein
MGQKKMIQIDKEIADRVKANYPDLSWNAIVSLLLSKDSSKDLSKDLSKDSSKDHMASTYATKDDLKIELKTLKDKFSTVLTQLIDKNNLQR